MAFLGCLLPINFSVLIFIAVDSPGFAVNQIRSMLLIRRLELSRLSRISGPTLSQFVSTRRLTARRTCKR